jgi:alkanesulfonate monooxygenase SsuD/methylene tetrahydromethanopterin reductase-like flavin-dependent oxidoreductase (luciferase family)
MQILKQIWTDDVVEFKGHFYNIPASKIGPKPVQEPHIPLYLGGYSQRTFARIANYANGWICVVRNLLDDVKSNIDKIRKECYKLGEIHRILILLRYYILTLNNLVIPIKRKMRDPGKDSY